MRLAWVLLIGWILTVSGLISCAAGPTLARDAVLARIKQLHGDIQVDANQPDQPIIAVNLRGPEVTNDDLALLAGMPNLKSLALEYVNVTNAGLAHLKNLPHIEHLSLTGTQMTDAGLKHLEGLPRLESLSLRTVQVTDAGVNSLASLRKLKHLEIDHTRVTLAGAHFLRDRLPKTQISYTEHPALCRAEGPAYHPPALQVAGALDRIVEALNAEDDYVRDATVDAILADRKALVQRLILMIDAENAEEYSFHARRAAVYLLGELRAEEAAPALAKALVNDQSDEDNFHIGRYNGAVFSALVKIGRPSIPWLIQNLQTSDNQVVRFESLMAMCHILGGKSHTLETLRKVRTRADDPAEIRRLDAAIKQVESYLKYATEHKEEAPLY
jgi:hypothetical protein